MQVRIYDCGSDGSETLRGQSDLRECFPDDDEYYHAFGELNRSGRLWTGGGAAPLVILMLVRQ